MNRRDLIKALGILGAGIALSPGAKGLNYFLLDEIKKSDFGQDFIWGAATAAYQIEGNPKADGKSESIWDRYTHTHGKIKNNENGDIACNSYNLFNEDIDLIKQMNMSAYRFSLAWTRILPNGTGPVNQKGIDYYKRLIDNCLKNNITPWITLYHWDLPQCLEDKGGWTNRDIIGRFSEYADVCTMQLGDQVKHWMILNEPLVFTALGYFFGIHAPGKKGAKNFFPAVHHAALCQAEGGRIARNNVKNGEIGTTFSCSINDPFHNHRNDIDAANRYDAIQNRLFIEPALGLGYPVKDMPA